VSNAANAAASANTNAARAYNIGFRSTFNVELPAQGAVTSLSIANRLSVEPRLRVGDTLLFEMYDGKFVVILTEIDTVNHVISFDRPLTVTDRDEFLQTTVFILPGVSALDYQRSGEAVTLPNTFGASVRSALSAQGYTAGRAENLDNLDAPISSINSVVSGGGTVIIGGGSGGTISLLSEGGGIYEDADPLTVYAGDVLPLQVALADAAGSPINLTGYALSALLTDAAYVPTSPNPTLTITSADEGLALVTVPVPASTGRYRLTIQRTKGTTEKVTHTAIALNVVRR
jgi:hypothetical protein